MKIKAKYISKVGRDAVLVRGQKFLNGRTRYADLPADGIETIKKAEENGWFVIEELYDKDGNLVFSASEAKTVVEEASVVEETAEEEAPVAVETAEEEAPAFDDMTKTELIAYAEENGIEGVSSTMKKSEIIAVIKG